MSLIVLRYLPEMRPNKQWWQRASGDPEARASRPVRALAFVTRLSVCILRKLQDEKLHLQSTSLAYTTLLLLVPFLAVTLFRAQGLRGSEPARADAHAIAGAAGRGRHRGRPTPSDLCGQPQLRRPRLLRYRPFVLGRRLAVQPSGKGLQQHLACTRRTQLVPSFQRLSERGPGGLVFLFAALGVTAIAFRGDNLYGLPDSELLNQLVIGLGRLVPSLRIVAIFCETRNGVRPISGAQNEATAMAFGGPRSSCVCPGAHSARYQDSRNDWTPCRMAWPFVSAGAHAPHSDETYDPTPTRGASHSARRLRSLAFLGSSPDLCGIRLPVLVSDQIIGCARYLPWSAVPSPV